MKKPMKKTPKKSPKNNFAKTPAKSTPKKKVVSKSSARNTANAELNAHLSKVNAKLTAANEQAKALRAENKRLTDKLDKMGNSDLELVEYFRAQYQAAEEARLELMVDVTRYKDIAQKISNFRSIEREELLKRAQEAAIKYQLQCKQMAEEIERLNSALQQ